MEAHAGDRLVTHGRTVGQQDRVAEIVEVLGDGGAPRTASASTTDMNTSWLPAPTASSGTTPPTAGPRDRRAPAPGGIVRHPAGQPGGRTRDR